MFSCGFNALCHLDVLGKWHHFIISPLRFMSKTAPIFMLSLLFVLLFCPTVWKTVGSDLHYFGERAHLLWISFPDLCY